MRSVLQGQLIDEDIGLPRGRRFKRNLVEKRTDGGRLPGCDRDHDGNLRLGYCPSAYRTSARIAAGSPPPPSPAAKGGRSEQVG